MTKEETELLKQKFDNLYHKEAQFMGPSEMWMLAWNWFLSNLRDKVVSDEEIESKAYAEFPDRKNENITDEDLIGDIDSRAGYFLGYKQALRDMQSTGLQDHSQADNQAGEEAVNKCNECGKALDNGTVFCSSDCRTHYYS